MNHELVYRLSNGVVGGHENSKELSGGIGARFNVFVTEPDRQTEIRAAISLSAYKQIASIR